jgi:hypothetical protein
VLVVCALPAGNGHRSNEVHSSNEQYADRRCRRGNPSRERKATLRQPPRHRYRNGAEATAALLVRTIAVIVSSHAVHQRFSGVQIAFARPAVAIVVSPRPPTIAAALGTSRPVIVVVTEIILGTVFVIVRMPPAASELAHPAGRLGYRLPRNSCRRHRPCSAAPQRRHHAGKSNDRPIHHEFPESSSCRSIRFHADRPGKSGVGSKPVSRSPQPAPEYRTPVCCPAT